MKIAWSSKTPPTEEELEQLSLLFQTVAASKQSRLGMAKLMQHFHFSDMALERCGADALEAAILSSNFDAIRSIHRELFNLLSDGMANAGTALRVAMQSAENRSHMVAENAARQRLVTDSDGKNRAKICARELWNDWQLGTTKHKSGAA